MTKICFTSIYYDLIAENPGFIAGADMPVGAGADACGDHADIAGIKTFTDLKFLNHSVFSILRDLVFDHSDRLEVLAVVRDEELHLFRHENPRILVLQEAAGQACDAGLLAKVDGDVDIHAMIALPHADTEIVVTGL